MTLEILTSGLLGQVRHGFFTRRGGASSGIFAGLNCGPGSSDQASAVSVNRARVAAALGLPPARLLSLHQVHSADVVIAGPEGWSERPRADAAVTAVPGIALSVLTADCAPILLHDREAGVAGAIHAGWRGALAGVVEATVAAMVRLGARPERTMAAVGPTISQRAYEVGPEFLESFLDEDRAFGRFFVNGEGDRYLFDLPGFVLARLRESGVGEAEWIGVCTYSDPARFYSYRRKTRTGEADYGRLISAIALPG
jgi:YfiH family protein